MAKDYPPQSNIEAPPIDPSLQKQLTLMGGTLLDGRPKLRLVWGQDPSITVFYRGKQRLRYIHHYTEQLVGWNARYYDSAGKLLEVKRFPPSLRPSEAAGALLVDPIMETWDIGIPRWFIEQYMPPSLACQDWDENRHTLDEETKTVIDELGPPPNQGMYEEAFLMIADHTKCCEKGNNVGCPGEYRAPNQTDIEYVRWLMWQLDQEPFKYTWEEMPPADIVAQAIKDSYYEAEELRLAEKRELSYYIQNDLMAHRRRLQGGSGMDLSTYHDLAPSFERARKF